MKPEYIDPHWPEDDAEGVAKSLETEMGGYGERWGNLAWTKANEAWRGQAWASHGPVVLDGLRKTRGFYVEKQKVPVVSRGKLRITHGAGIPQSGTLPPTKEGWARFLALAPSSELTFGALQEAAVFWWGRSAPRNLLSKAKAKKAA